MSPDEAGDFIPRPEPPGLSLGELANLANVILNPCPASIMLLGAAANCSKPAGHDGMHLVKIEWRTG